MEQKMVRRRPQNLCTTYADTCNVSVNAFGFVVSFGVNAGNFEEDTVAIDEHTSVGMSAEHAKSLYELLGRQVQVFEQRFGAIRNTGSPGKAIQLQ